MKKIYIIHTSLVSHDDLQNLFHEIIPEAEIFNIVDDSLLHDVMANGGVNEKITGCVCYYFLAGDRNGADLIFNQCSSVGKAADVAKQLVSIPVVKVDEAMAEKAVSEGKKIGVVATVKCTMRPSCDLVLEKAAEMGEKVEVVEYLVDGALDILMKEKNREKHNELVLGMIKKAEAECDIILLAQGSMVVLLPLLEDTKKQVLTSPRLGVEKARKVLLGE